MIIATPSYLKSSVFKMFSFQIKTQSRFEERFRKTPFSLRISVDGRLDRRNNAVCSNFSGVDSTPLLGRHAILCKNRLRTVTQRDKTVLSLDLKRFD